MAARVPSKIDSLQCNSLQKMKANKHKSIWQTGSRMNITTLLGWRVHNMLHTALPRRV